MRVVVSIAVLFTLGLLGLAFADLKPEENSIILFLGNFHPLLLHLPMGALMLLLVLELANTIKPTLKLENANTLLLWFSVVSVVPTVVLGFFLASSGGYNIEKLFLHKWLGWATAFIVVWLLVLKTWSDLKPAVYAKLYKGFLFINVILLSVAGHYGGSLTHGSDYLTKDMPDSMKLVFGVKKTEAERLVEKLKSQPKDSIKAETFVFFDTIQHL